MDLSCRSLADEPAAGHSAHARAHAHYETGDHEAGLAWMDAWVTGDGASTESLSHFSWHAALHELSLGDLDAVRRRYDAQLRPEHGLGCRALVDSGSLLFRWAITPGAERVPDMADVADVTGRDVLERPATPFLAMHAAVALLAIDDRAGLLAARRLGGSTPHPTQREVVAPLARALVLLHDGRCSEAADPWPGCGATYPVSAAPTPSASWSRRPGSARSCGRAGTSTPARCWTHGWTAATRPRDRRWRETCLEPAGGPLRPA